MYHCHISYLELTSQIFVPDLSLALEYQGKQHFVSIPVFGSLQIQEERDKEKKEV
jgi:hypothetical protein